MKVLDELYYSETHEWVKVVNDEAYIGITDYAQKELGDIVYIDLPEAGKKVTAGEEIGSIESAKAVVDFVTPVSGEIMKVNDEVIDNVVLLNESPYEEGWLLKLKLSKPDELETLLSAGEYRKQFSE